MVSKEFKVHLKNISLLTSLALASTKIKKLTIKEKELDYKTRGQLHVIFQAPTGSMKSTLIGYIAASVSQPVHDSITSAGLVGSIDGKTMQLIPGTGWTARNKLILMDEFKFRRKSDDWLCFLKLLEDQKYTKKIGMYSADTNEKDGDLYLKVTKGQIEMNTRFAAIIATMKRFEAYVSDDFKAFVNRCIPYRFTLSMDEIEYILSGRKSFFDIKNYKVDPNPVVKNTDYRKIVKIVRENIPNNDIGKENFARSVTDLCRIFAITGKHDNKLFKDVIEWKIETYKAIGAFFREGKRI